MLRLLFLYSILLSSSGWLLTPSVARALDASSFFDTTFGDFSEELNNARDAGKRGVLLMFEQDECPFCHRMKLTVLNQQKVQDYFHEHFLIFSVDVEGDLEITDFDGNHTTQKDFAVKEHRVRATPVFLFVGLDGKPMPNGRFTGATNGPEEFLLLGKYIVEGANEKTNFTRYKRAAN